MRLSEVLSRSEEQISEAFQIENFLGPKRLARGTHRSVDVGTVLRNYQCAGCKDQRSFQSRGKLSCLVTGGRTVSIDVVLSCPGCNQRIGAWFIVRSVGNDLFGPSPTVRLDRVVEHRTVQPNQGEDPGLGLRQLLERAKIAHQIGLGAGAMVYLRKIMEAVTYAAATACGVSAEGKNGGRKPFSHLLKEVDEKAQIIPPQFSGQGYALFSELSDQIHGDGTEEEAMSRFGPCRALIEGILSNTELNEKIKDAIQQLGWNESQGNGASEGAAL